MRPRRIPSVVWEYCCISSIYARRWVDERDSDVVIMMMQSFGMNEENMICNKEERR